MLDSVLQFGAGPFVRAFADLILAQANRGETPIPGGAVVVAEGLEADALATEGGVFEVAVRWNRDGRTWDEIERVDAISRVVRAETEWPEALAFARRPELRWILLDAESAMCGSGGREIERPAPGRAPRGTVAKLLDVLLARNEGHAFDATVVPCGFGEGNGEQLRAAVLSLARRWRVEPRVESWLREGVRWLDTLADRVVVESRFRGAARDAAWPRVVTEPYAFWGIEVIGTEPFWTHPAVVLTEDLRPYRLRTGRVLKAARAALAVRARHLGLETPGRALGRADVWGWLEHVLREEIVPVLSARVPEAEEFARCTLERLRNPLSIPLFWPSDLDRESETHLRPTLREHFSLYGRTAPLLSAALDG